MALTRAMLKGMGLTEEQVSAIIEEHTNVTSGLKDQIKQYKADSDHLQTVQQELDGLKDSVKKDNWQKKYEDEHKAFDDYKKEISSEKALSKVKAAYKKLLKAANIGDDHIDAIMRVTDFSKMKMKEDSDELVDANQLTESIKTDWKGFIPVDGVKTDRTSTPPGDGKKDPQTNADYAKQLEAKYSQNLYGKGKEE
jgi:plasmid maintenance system antidote protein VapI